MPQQHPPFVSHILRMLAYWKAEIAASSNERPFLVDEHAGGLFKIFDHGFGYAQTAPPTIDLLVQLFPHFEAQGYWHTSVWTLYEWAAEQAADDVQRVQLGNLRGVLQRLAGQAALAGQTHVALLPLAVSINNTPLPYIETLFYLGQAHFEGHELPEAETAVSQMLAAAQTLSGEQAIRKQAAGNNLLGLIQRELGQQEEAEASLRAASALWAQLAHPAYHARTLNNLSLLLSDLERYDEAEQLLTQALQMLAATADELDKVRLSINLGRLHYQQGKLQAAYDAFLAANTPYLQASKDIPQQALVLTNIGGILNELNRFEQSWPYLVQAKKLWCEAGNLLMAANASVFMGENCLARLEPASGNAHLKEAQTIFEQYPKSSFAQSRLAHVLQLLSIPQ